MPAWRPPFRIEKSKNAANDGHKTVDGAEAIEEVVEVAGSGQKVRPPTGTGKDSSVEWRASWEKWTAQMNGAMSDQGQFAGAASGPGTGVVDHLPFEARVADDHPRGEVTAAAAVNMQTAPPAHVPNAPCCDGSDMDASKLRRRMQVRRLIDEGASQDL